MARIGFAEGTLTKDGFELKQKIRKEKFRSAKNKKVDPKTTKEYQGLRGGGRAKLRGGGMSQRGLGKAFKKGGKA